MGFPQSTHKKMWANESKIQTRFKAATCSAGVRYRRPYNCRHTFVSVMLSSGENILYVADQMGHKDWSMLVKTYGRWIKDVDAKAGDRAASVESNLQQSLSLSSNHRAEGAPPIESPKLDDVDLLIMKYGEIRVEAVTDATNMRQVR